MSYTVQENVEHQCLYGTYYYKMIDMSNAITIDHTQRMTAFKEISKLQQNKCKNGHFHFKCRNVTRNIIFYLMCHFDIPKCTEITIYLEYCKLSKEKC